MATSILVGDVRERLKEIPDESINCVVTSPPYFGLRDYGTPGQIGLETTVEEFCCTMVAIFRDMRRVLRSDGTCWLNIGDSYAGGGNGARDPDKWPKQHRNVGSIPQIIHGKASTGLRPKNLLMVPARLAIALQSDGWYLRSDIIWSKPNPMPESVSDRPTSAHEHIFLLTKSAQYEYNADSIRTPTENKNGKMPDGWDTGPGAHGSFHREGREAGKRSDKQRGHGRRHEGFNDRWDQMSREEQQANGANIRNVWEIATRPFSGAHFATFPPEIPRRCIKAGCPEGGTVLDPFGGAGTTALVAEELGRDCILIELNPAYAEMARKRIYDAAPLLTSVEVA